MKTGQPTGQASYTTNIHIENYSHKQCKRINYSCVFNIY